MGFDIRVSPEIMHRVEFARLLNERGLHGIGCEVGVCRGYFTTQLLHEWDCEAMILVDHYLPTHDYPEGRTLDEQIARAALEHHAHKLKWVKQNSVVALSAIDDGTLDYMNIDGGHRYCEVDADMRIGWQKMKPGGLFTGHDFDQKFPEVPRAVKEFSARENVTVWLTTEYHENWSWYCWKPLVA